jgi:hypothetical protein
MESDTSYQLNGDDDDDAGDDVALLVGWLSRLFGELGVVRLVVEVTLFVVGVWDDVEVVAADLTDDIDEDDDDNVVVAALVTVEAINTAIESSSSKMIMMMTMLTKYMTRISTDLTLTCRISV